MPNLARTFLTGLAAILPIMITLALLWWIGSTLEQVLGGILQAILPELLYFPGLGIFAGLVLILALGFLLRAYLVRGLFDWLEGLMERIPVVKTIHGTVRDVTRLLSGDIHERFGQAVLVSFPGTDFKLVGFITREDFTGLPDNLGGDDTIAVYTPMSYQIGGYTLMLPRKRVEKLDLSLEDAMRYALTAGVSARKENGRS
ncbi:hypothetical protein B1C78_05985 [Thioalkalivibrio denitrificans]|uniref:DUF502 domain-containing protein n=1 Tax=Thioalkalivibrio denitrificans TaxID=108003 RepID=A0A1V3NKR6_9GAMM|nr:DUF502 domain-containing protein [Thioalkalivibrio denitrificans]OOG25655.1 hypothetical protein B1C78_05985 [Thioalkalivibrio denitrificans]